MKNGQLVVCIIGLLLLLNFLVEKRSYAEESTKNTVEIASGVDKSPTEENISSNNPLSGTFFIKAISDFNFDSLKIGSTVIAKIVGVTPENYSIDTSGIEVVDLRGTGSGWRVSTYVESITLTGEEDRKLEKFELSIPTKEVVSKSSSLEKKPQANSIVLAGYGNTTEKTIFYASTDKGMGKYTNIFQKKVSSSPAVTLTVPKTAKKGLYSGKLIWTLIDGPGN